VNVWLCVLPPFVVQDVHDELVYVAWDGDVKMIWSPAVALMLVSQVTVTSIVFPGTLL
jgi:hypothetical protein